MAISLVGDRFTLLNEQTALLEVLTKSTSKYGWTTTFAYGPSLQRLTIDLLILLQAAIPPRRLGLEYISSNIRKVN